MVCTLHAQPYSGPLSPMELVQVAAGNMTACHTGSCSLTAILCTLWNPDRAAAGSTTIDLVGVVQVGHAACQIDHFHKA